MGSQAGSATLASSVTYSASRVASRLAAAVQTHIDSDRLYQGALVLDPLLHGGTEAQTLPLAL